MANRGLHVFGTQMDVQRPFLLKPSCTLHCLGTPSVISLARGHVACFNISKYGSLLTQKTAPCKTLLHWVLLGAWTHPICLHLWPKSFSQVLFLRMELAYGIMILMTPSKPQFSLAGPLMFILDYTGE